MRRIHFVESLKAAVLIGGTLLAASALAQSQIAYRSNMMRGYGFGWMGAYSDIGMPILLFTVVAGLVAWIVTQERN